MKKSIAILIAVATVAASFAGPAKPKAAATSIHCAVMTKDSVQIAEATKSKHFQDYKGRRYYFCCPVCTEAFSKNPAKYAKNASVVLPHKVVGHTSH